MEEMNEPIQFELRTEREVAVLMHVLAVGGVRLLESGSPRGAQTASNLQMRLAKSDPQGVEAAMEEYAPSGFLSPEGEMSVSAAIGKMVEQEEVDPDEAMEGGL